MKIRNMFPIGLFVLLAVLLFTTAGRGQSNTGAAEQDLARRVKQLEEYVLTFQRVTLTSQIREIGRTVEAAQISTDAKEKVRKALAEAYASLESEKLDVRTIDAVVVAFSKAISKSGGNGADVRECLDKCKEAYDNAKAECDEIEDGIERANCVIAAVNR